MPKPKKPRRRKDTLLYMSALQMMEGLSLIEEQGEYLYKSHLAITALAVLCIGVRQGWRCVSCLALSLEGSYRRWLGVDRCGTRHTHGIAGSLAGNNPIHALAVRLLRRQPEPELLAHHGGQEGAHRVRLPAGGARDGGDGGAARSAQQCWMQTAPCAQVCAWTCKTPLKSVGATARRRVGATARRHPNPAEAHRRWRGERNKPVRLGVRDHHTRSLCAESPAQTEQWWCWLCRRRIIFGPTCARGRGILAAAPELRITGAAAQTRMVSVARIRLVSRKSTRLFKGIICDDISEFESHMPSHAVRSLWRFAEAVLHGCSRRSR